MPEIYDRLRPTWRTLLRLIGVKSGGLYNARAERLFMRALDRDWPYARLEALLGRLLEQAEQLEAFAIDNYERRHGGRSLARANGRGSAGQCPGYIGPKTPAARERVCHVVAAGQKPVTASARGTAQRSGVAT